MAKIKATQAGMNLNKYLAHWQSLSPWFQPVAVKLFLPWFAVIPIVLHIMKGVPSTIAIGTTAQWNIHLSLPFKWWFLWWGSFLYLIAFILYNLACPAFIKRYRNYSEYCSARHSPRWMAHELKKAVEASNEEETKKLFDRLVSKKLAAEIGADDPSALGDVTVEERGSVYRFAYEGKRYEFVGSEHDSQVESVDREVFWEVFEPFARSRPFLRSATWFFLIAAFACVFVVLLQNVWAVLPDAIQNLLQGTQSLAG